MGERQKVGGEGGRPEITRALLSVPRQVTRDMLSRLVPVSG